MSAATAGKFPADQARKVAEELRAQLAPYCSRIEVAGSLRRGKPEVGDIELLYIPLFVTRTKPGHFWETEQVNMVDSAIAGLESSGILKRRLNVKGSEVFGEKNKLMIHCASGIPVDLFATTAENWWVSLVIRTGSKQMNLDLTANARKHGKSLNAYGAGVTILNTGEKIAAHSEQEVFALCHTTYRDPEDR